MVTLFDWLPAKWLVNPGNLKMASSLAQDKTKCIDIFLISQKKTKQQCCGYSTEAPQEGASNEYPQHAFMEK